MQAVQCLQRALRDCKPTSCRLYNVIVLALYTAIWYFSRRRCWQPTNVNGLLCSEMLFGLLFIGRQTKNEKKQNDLG